MAEAIGTDRLRRAAHAAGPAGLIALQHYPILLVRRLGMIRLSRSGGIVMLEFATLTYGVLASFVVASVTRNKRAARVNPPVLTLFAWLLTAFSLSSALLLIGAVGYRALSAG
jgi:hypothetical protein